MGAITSATPVQASPSGQPAGTPLSTPAFRFTVTNVAPSNSYSTGGDTITAAQLGLQRVLFGIANVVTAAATATNGPGEATILPQSNGGALLKCQMPAGGEETAGNNLSAAVVQVVAFGY